MQGNRNGKTVMSHTPDRVGQAPDQASSGRQTGAALPPGRIIRKGTPQKPASHPTSHKQQHDNQAGNNPRQTSPPSLTVTGATVVSSGSDLAVGVRQLGSGDGLCPPTRVCFSISMALGADGDRDRGGDCRLDEVGHGCRLRYVDGMAACDLDDRRTRPR